MTPPLIRLPHGSDAPSIPVRLTWLGGVPAIDVGAADEDAMAEIRRWVTVTKWESFARAWEMVQDPKLVAEEVNDPR